MKIEVYMEEVIKNELKTMRTSKQNQRLAMYETMIVMQSIKEVYLMNSHDKFFDVKKYQRTYMTILMEEVYWSMEESKVTKMKTFIIQEKFVGYAAHYD